MFSQWDWRDKVASHIKNTSNKRYIVTGWQRGKVFMCWQGTAFQSLYESGPGPKYTQNLPQDSTLVESSGSFMVHFSIEVRSEWSQAEYRQLEQKETANLQLRRGRAGPRSRGTSTQNKAIPGEGPWIRKAETEDYRDKARARKPGNSNNSTEPGLLPGILNPHLSTTNMLENSQCWCVFQFLVTAPCRGLLMVPGLSGVDGSSCSLLNRASERLDSQKSTAWLQRKRFLLLFFIFCLSNSDCFSCF